MGPLRVAVQLPDDARGAQLRLLVSGHAVMPEVHDGWCRFELASLTDHEVVVIG